MVVLFEHKGLVKEIKNAKFISENLEIIEKWASRLESLPLYNMSIVGEGAFKEYVEKYPTDETEDTQGINFVSLLKNKDFISTITNQTKQLLKTILNTLENICLKASVY